MAEFVIITGMSGAGRSEAAKHLEDLGWFVIDNLPPTLIPNISAMATAAGTQMDHVALVIGTSDYRDEVAAALTALRATPDCRVRTLFLQTETPELVRRYRTTRRRHPFGEYDNLSDAVEAERLAVDPLRADADVVIDTTALNVHQLRDRVIEYFGSEDTGPHLQTRVLSFGFKHGLPLDVDLVLDCRFLPNPHWVEGLRDQTGLDEAVREYVLEQPVTEAFLADLRGLLETVMPAYAAEGKAYLTLALGCTGGRHRSVAIAEEARVILTEIGFRPTVTHRDIKR